MNRPPPRSNRLAPPFPYPTLFRSVGRVVQEPAVDQHGRAGIEPQQLGDDPIAHAAFDLVTTETPRCAAGVAHAGIGEAVGLAVEPVHAVHHETVPALVRRSEEHTSELQSLMRISYAVFCLKK